MNLIAWAAWLAGLLGFGLLIGGVALIHTPTALIVAGFGLLGWSLLADRAAARVPRKHASGSG
ncbi:hypothetical protein V2J92_22120 [Pseudomonas alliivorans]|uniref:Uncharacterized protein n=1 Tax=Pseudomonas syringae CC1417 TaxID=1357272 RepID=A0AAU8LGI9_PSESX|nr:hypothetical protein [Pseudomonas alliivorans]MEE5171564.1 hypothetical protein [Pseudomonas alliivorans]